MKLKRYFSDRLSRMMTSRNMDDLSRGTEQRLRYVQALCSLYATKQAWMKYCSLRCQQVATCVGIPEDDNRGFCEAVAQFTRSLSYVTAMIDEDVRLFNSGVFSDISLPTPDAIRSIYIETLADVAATIAQTLEEELEEKAVRSPLSTTKRDATERLRRTSLVGPAKKEGDWKMSNELTIIGHLLLEKLPPASCGADGRGSSHAMAGMYLGVIVKFVSAMSQLEEYIDGLRDVLVLEDIAASRKLNSRKNLKSEYCFYATDRCSCFPDGVFSLATPIFCPCISQYSSSSNHYHLLVGSLCTSDHNSRPTSSVLKMDFIFFFFPISHVSVDTGHPSLLWSSPPPRWNTISSVTVSDVFLVSSSQVEHHLQCHSV